MLERRTTSESSDITENSLPKQAQARIWRTSASIEESCSGWRSFQSDGALTQVQEVGCDPRRG